MNDQQQQPPNVIVIQQDKTLTKVVLWVLFIFLVLPVGLCCGGFGLVNLMIAARKVAQPSHFEKQAETEENLQSDLRP